VAGGSAGVIRLTSFPSSIVKGPDGLRVADLEALLAYEGQTKSRPPFQTLLANRITRATAK